MSFPYVPNAKDLKLESLQNQHAYLNLLRLRHLQWMSLAESSEVEAAHLKIAELIELITERYTRLLGDRGVTPLPAASIEGRGRRPAPK